MQEETEQQTEPALDKSTYFLMGGVGLFFDVTGVLLNLIPVAGQVLEEGNDLFADMTFWLWFEMKGMKYKKTTMFGAYILKFIPFLNILPEYTLMIVMMYMQAKAKEKLEKAERGVPGKQFGRMVGTNNRNDSKTTPESSRQDKNRQKETYPISSRQGNDALDQLNNKENRSREENVKLVRASMIMEHHSIANDDKSDPVLLAAWNKAQAGIKPYGPTNKDGYKFNNVSYM